MIEFPDASLDDDEVDDILVDETDAIDDEIDEGMAA